MVSLLTGSDRCPLRAILVDLPCLAVLLAVIAQVIEVKKPSFVGRQPSAHLCGGVAYALEGRMSYDYQREIRENKSH